MTLAVAVERGAKKTFAWVWDWPGWCRGAKNEELALTALAGYAVRYQPVAEAAGLALPAADFDVVERVDGRGATDFGVPNEVLATDHAPVPAEAAARLAAVVSASWLLLERVGATAPPELRKGPRGGGRDRDKVLQHVLSAEASYARMLALRHREPTLGDRAAIAALRDDVLTVLGAPSDGTPPVANGWPPRYAARRIAWHVLDHAWEIEDRSPPA